MALSQKHRSTIYRNLAPILGEEEAEALLSQFPSRELDEPASKEFVHAEIAGVRLEIADLRTEMRTGFANVDAEFANVRTEMAGLRADIAGIRSEVSDRLRLHTVWVSSAMAVGMGLAATIARLGG